MVSNDRSLTNQKDGLGNLLNLTNQNFYVRLVDEKKNRENNSVLAGRPLSLPRSFWLTSLPFSVNRFFFSFSSKFLDLNLASYVL